jgi:NADPH-dependent 2,4-dienoyl-CoA reductase/sulfur reductase-like enzyme
MKLERVLIVGGGMAGLHTARLLRENGFAGEVTLLGAEPHRPYDRPPLSKQVLAGKAETVDELAFPFDFDASAVTCRFNEHAVAWKPGAVATDRGASLPYDALVVATGSEPVRLPFMEEDSSSSSSKISGKVQTLRTYEDAVRLRSVLKPDRRLSIIGAGWIGAEVATAASAAGCVVTVSEALERPLAALFPEAIGETMAGWYAEAGVELRLLTPVGSIDTTADRTLVAVGARPDVRWLGAAFTYARDGSLLVDSQLRTEVGNVFAVGDCAAYFSERYGKHIRVEHWDNALRGPATVVDNVLGGSAEHDPVPYFWSEQFGRMVQYVGRHSPSAPAADTMVVRGDLAEAAWSVCWLDASSRLTAVLAVGKPRDLAQGRKLITASSVLDAVRLADPATALTAAAV